MTDCAVCGRDYSLDPQGHHSGPRFKITSADEKKIWEIKQESYRQKKSRLILLKRDLFASQFNSSLVNPGETGEVDRSSTDEVSWLDGVMKGINFTGNDEHMEFDSLQTTARHKTLIRTMPDRSANINDVCWALRNADNHQIGMNMLLLHRYSFVWISVLPPPENNDIDLSKQHTSLLIAELQKNYMLLKLRFAAINKLLSGTARVEWHGYISYADMFLLGRDRQFYTEPGSGCSACINTNYSPASNVQNATQPEFSGILTNGDLAELLIIKEFSFETDKAAVGFLSGVDAANRSQSIETKLQINDARSFFQETNQTKYFRPLKNVNLFSASDELWDNHRGEQTVFRTMPDRRAGVKDLIWTLEASAKHRIGMNVYLLHKRHLLWIHVKTPVPNPDADQARKERVRTRLLISTVKQYYTLNKNNLRELNRALHPTAKVDYFKYPNLKWVESITEHTVNQSLLYLEIVAAIGIGILVYNQGLWSPMKWAAEPVFGAAKSFGEASWGPINAMARYGARYGVATPLGIAADASKAASKAAAKAAARYILAEEVEGDVIHKSNVKQALEVSVDELEGNIIDPKQARETSVDGLAGNITETQSDPKQTPETDVAGTFDQLQLDQNGRPVFGSNLRKTLGTASQHALGLGNQRQTELQQPGGGLGSRSTGATGRPLLATPYSVGSCDAVFGGGQ